MLVQSLLGDGMVFLFLPPGPTPAISFSSGAAHTTLGCPRGNWALQINAEDGTGSGSIVKKLLLCHEDIRWAIKKGVVLGNKSCNHHHRHSFESGAKWNKVVYELP